MLWHMWLLPDVSLILGSEWTGFVICVTCHTGEWVDCVCDVCHLSYWGVSGLCDLCHLWTGEWVDCVCNLCHLSYWGLSGLCLWSVSPVILGSEWTVFVMCVACNTGEWMDCVCEACRCLRLCIVVVERQCEGEEARDWWSSWWYSNCFTWIPIISSVLCAVCLYILWSFCIVHMCCFCPVNYLVIDHMISMLAVSETGTKYKKLLKKSWTW